MGHWLMGNGSQTAKLGVQFCVLSPPSYNTSTQRPRINMEPTRLLQEVLAALPSAPAAEAFRMAMLLCHAAPSLEALEDEQLRMKLLGEIQLQISMHEDRSDFLRTY